jgi:hypothetical protein
VTILSGRVAIEELVYATDQDGVRLRFLKHFGVVLPSRRGVLRRQRRARKRARKDDDWHVRVFGGRA